MKIEQDKMMYLFKDNIPYRLILPSFVEVDFSLTFFIHLLGT